MQLQQRHIEPSQRILSDYVENLQGEIMKLAEEIRAAQDDEFRKLLAVRFTLKTQLVNDLQRCIGHLS